MILVDEQIKDAVDRGEIELSDFSPECLQPASYDLRVGEEGYTLSAGVVVNLQAEGQLAVQPGDFALVMTHEKLRLPADMLGRFGLRSAYARTGLLATVGPQVDPGFEGKLVIGVVNFSSQVIILRYLTPFCTLELYKLPRAAAVPYKGPYQGQEHLTDEIISKVPTEPFPLRRQEGPTSYRGGLPGGLAVFHKEKQAFERLKPELLKTHRGQYVVIREEKPVLFGSKKVELAQQAYAQFGYRSLYIGLLEEGPEVAHIPTPRALRR